MSRKTWDDCMEQMVKPLAKQCDEYEKAMEYNASLVKELQAQNPVASGELIDDLVNLIQMVGEWDKLDKRNIYKKVKLILSKYQSQDKPTVENFCKCPNIENDGSCHVNCPVCNLPGMKEYKCPLDKPTAPAGFIMELKEQVTYMKNGPRKAKIIEILSRYTPVPEREHK